MAVNPQPKHNNFAIRSVVAATQFKAAYDQMVALRAEWDSLSYGTGGTAIIDSDFTSNPYLNAAALQAFYTAQGNLVTYWIAGNGTNISGLIP